MFEVSMLGTYMNPAIKMRACLYREGEGATSVTAAYVQTAAGGETSYYNVQVGK